MDKLTIVRDLKVNTNFSIKEIRDALVQNNWDKDLALKYLKVNIRASEKPVGAGAIFSYIHHNGQMGSLVELKCGTDFVSRNEEFKKLGNSISMHVAAMSPKDTEELMDQTFISDTSKTVKEVLTEASNSFKEPVEVSRFTVFIIS